MCLDRSTAVEARVFHRLRLAGVDPARAAAVALKVRARYDSARRLEREAYADASERARESTRRTVQLARANHQAQVETGRTDYT